MTDPFSDRYWVEEFQVTQADLDRIAAHIRETGQARDLTALARRLVRGRLRYGPETSVPAQPAWAEDPSVRLWDPAGEWKESDQTIVWTWSYRAKRDEVMIGEITCVDPTFAHVAVDDIYQPVRKFTRAAAGSPDAIAWHQKVRKAVETMKRGASQEEQVELVVLEHGERVASQLLDTLRADERFVHLAGRWFLHELAVSPTEEQLAGLAWAMVPLGEPRPTADLAPLVQPPLAEGAPGLFGLYLALCDRSNLFENVDPGKRPRWILAAPPPGSCTPRHATYDPETYGVLCLPGAPVPPEVIGRLWNLGLLKAVL